MNFFHLLFPCANILFVLRPPPPPPISFPMVRPLIKTGTVLIWYISSFLYSNVTLLNIRIETFHGSLIRQWEVNSIHPNCFFSVVCQLLSKHILATFCDNDVARSNYFLNTNCNTLLFYFFVIILVSLRQTLWVGHEKYRPALFYEAKFLRTVSGILTDPCIDTSYVYSVEYIISNQLKGKQFFREVNSGNKREHREGNNIFSMCKISFNLVLGVFLWLNASCSYIHRCMYIMRFDKN